MSLTPDVVRHLNGLAADWYASQLERSPAALAYLTGQRGLTRATVRAWGLGHAPGWASEGTGLLRYLATQGWGETAVIAAGLATSGPRGIVDLFRDRIVFPILDREGAVLAFAGRRIRDDPHAGPKYLNSPATPLYRKAETLYGWTNADAIEASGEALVVEGYLDLLTLWQAGCRNVVAPCGTALTPDHFEGLAALAPRITLALDGDDAGRAATRAALLLDAAHRVDMGAITLPEGNDPDSLVRAGGPAGFISLQARRSRRAWLWWSLEDRHAAAAAHDVEARVAWKDEWAELVRDHARDRREAAGLLRRMERAVHLPDGLLVDEVLAGWTGDARWRDELLLAALATHWDLLYPVAALVRLHGPTASAARDRWVEAGAPTRCATLQRLAARERAAMDAALSVELARLRPQIGVLIARLGRAAVDPDAGIDDQDRAREAFITVRRLLSGAAGRAV